MTEYKGIVHSVESFGSVDGPGVRFVVFMQGCKMRCKYCHNPETWSLKGGTEYSPKELFDKAFKYRMYWGKDLEKGGVTVSGGEPLLQIEFVTEFFKLLKEKGVHTAIDTAGQPFERTPDFLGKFDELLRYTDLVLLDLKEFDEEKHKALTSVNNSNILEMAQYLSEKGVPMWIRHVLVPKLTDDEKGLKGLADFVSTLKTVEKVEILPYHTLGILKYENMGIPYPLGDVSAPSKEEMDVAKSFFIN